MARRLQEISCAARVIFLCIVIGTAVGVSWTLTSLNHGAPYDAITSRKKKNLLRTINYFLLQHKLFDTSYRLDVVGVVKVTGGVEINHYESITA
ncbi:MAG: hypothetical protein UX44_C0026G0007 [candidate division WWE3 bacterium GW2011_GWA1_46_21]|uniref:Uncharacterized protein n=1 Tax=candidate division WWE3 bacterium GW2011_GWA1_46_21 TaxID=1619107 RepID=A0A0G1PC34_UNCKA|nr:MAG: hypothetical protein UX44_C0026G0007 [candidate division WWE3 bacterium GW2011_GWA1_46_21]